MDLKEIVDLIAIRDYVVNSSSNPTVDRATVRELNGILLLLDKKIIEILKEQPFKEYIGYADVKSVIETAAKLTNIKSGLKK